MFLSAGVMKNGTNVNSKTSNNNNTIYTLNPSSSSQNNTKSKKTEKVKKNFFQDLMAGIDAVSSKTTVYIDLYIYIYR